MVQGNKLTAEEQQVTEESATYRAEWVTTGMTKCKKGERQTIHVQLQVTCLLVSFGLFSHFLRSIFKRNFRTATFPCAERHSEPKIVLKPTQSRSIF